MTDLNNQTKVTMIPKGNAFPVFGHEGKKKHLEEISKSWGSRNVIKIMQYIPIVNLISAIFTLARAKQLTDSQGARSALIGRAIVSMLVVTGPLLLLADLISDAISGVFVKVKEKRDDDSSESSSSKRESGSNAGNKGNTNPVNGGEGANGGVSSTNKASRQNLETTRRGTTNTAGTSEKVSDVAEPNTVVKAKTITEKAESFVNSVLDTAIAERNEAILLSELDAVDKLIAQEGIAFNQFFIRERIEADIKLLTEENIGLEDVKKGFIAKKSVLEKRLEQKRKEIKEKGTCIRSKAKKEKAEMVNAKNELEREIEKIYSDIKLINNTQLDLVKRIETLTSQIED